MSVRFRFLDKTDLIEYLRKENYTAEADIIEPRNIDGAQFSELNELDLLKWKLNQAQKKLILNCKSKILSEQSNKQLPTSPNPKGKPQSDTKSNQVQTEKPKLNFYLDMTKNNTKSNKGPPIKPLRANQRVPVQVIDPMQNSSSGQPRKGLTLPTNGTHESKISLQKNMIKPKNTIKPENKGHHRSISPNISQRNKLPLPPAHFPKFDNTKKSIVDEESTEEYIGPSEMGDDYLSPETNVKETTRERSTPTKNANILLRPLPEPPRSSYAPANSSTTISAKKNKNQTKPLNLFRRPVIPPPPPQNEPIEENIYEVTDDSSKPILSNRRRAALPPPPPPQNKPIEENFYEVTDDSSKHILFKQGRPTYPPIPLNKTIQENIYDVELDTEDASDHIYEANLDTPKIKPRAAPPVSKFDRSPVRIKNPSPPPNPPPSAKNYTTHILSGNLGNSKDEIWNVSGDLQSLPKPPIFESKFKAKNVKKPEVVFNNSEFNPNCCPYYRNTDRRGAKQLLRKIPNLDDGAFLFRSSDTYFLVLTIYHKNKFYNVGVQRNDDGTFYCKTDADDKWITFKTLEEFVKHYKKNALTMKSGESNIDINLKELLPDSIF